MNLHDENVKKVSTVALIAIFGILVLILIKPIIFAVIGGLILAYIFYPLHRKTVRFVRSETLSALIVLVVPIIIILVPLWFILPLMVEQVFGIFQFSQKIEVGTVITTLFPTASDQFTTQMVVTANTIISKASSAILSSLVTVFINAPIILLNIFIMAFVFFYAVRDGEKLQKYISEVSPLTKSQEKLFVKHFKDVTDSILFGQVVAGLVQGIFAGIGLLIFGVDNALVLSVIAIFLSIIPHVGPAFVWIPVTIFLFAAGSPIAAALYFAYNLLFVSTIDNVVRSYVVSKRTNISAGVVLVGMIGGLFVFGILGIILGPLIFAYFIAFLELYKNKSFLESKESQEKK